MVNMWLMMVNNGNKWDGWWINGFMLIIIIIDTIISNILLLSLVVYYHCYVTLIIIIIKPRTLDTFIYLPKKCRRNICGFLWVIQIDRSTDYLHISIDVPNSHWLVDEKRGVWNYPFNKTGKGWCRWYTSHRPKPLFLPGKDTKLIPIK